MTGAIVRPGSVQGSHPDDILLARMVAAVAEDLRLNTEESDLARRAAVFAVADRIDQLAADRDAQRGRADRAERERDEAVAALEPFAAAAAGIPSMVSDVMPACRVTNDARCAGTVTSIETRAFRAAALAARTGGRADG